MNIGANYKQVGQEVLAVGCGLRELALEKGIVQPPCLELMKGSQYSGS